MDALQILGEAKNYWNAIHAVADKLAEKNVAGRVYLFLQGTTGSAIVDTANGDTIDEQLVGIVGDVLGGFALSTTGVGFAVNVKLIADGHSPGDMLKSTYQFIKYSDGQYWKYEKNFATMGAQGYMVVPYARVLYTKITNGPDVVVPDGPRPAYYQEISEATYLQYTQTKLGLLNEISSALLNTKIENTNGVLKVTMPDGTVYAMGDSGANIINGGTKNDVLYGMGGNDTLNGGSGRDTLIGGLHNDKLYGGADYDTYVAGGGDTIFDQDDSGQVYLFNNDPRYKLTGGKQLEKDGNVYEGTTASGQKVTYTIDGANLTVSAGGQTFTIQSYEKDKSSLDIVLVDKDEEDKYVNVSVSDATLSEDGGSMVFTVTLSKELSESISIDLVTLDGSAVSGEDYGSSSNFTVTIAAGSTSAQYSVPIINDDIPEPTETFTVAPYSYEYSGDEKVLLNFRRTMRVANLSSEMNEIKIQRKAA